MAASSVRAVIMVTAALARAAALAATAAPAAASGLHFSAQRFHTVTSLPVSINLCAIAAPILPSAATPTCMQASPALSGGADDRRLAGCQEAQNGCSLPLVPLQASRMRYGRREQRGWRKVKTCRLTSATNTRGSADGGAKQ